MGEVDSLIAQSVDVNRACDIVAAMKQRFPDAAILREFTLTHGFTFKGKHVRGALVRCSQSHCKV